MPFDERLAARIREALAADPAVSERRMFGGIAFLWHGHMFAGVANTSLMARVGKAGYADALACPHVRVMDFTGRPMAGYVFVGPEGLKSAAQLRSWLDRCLAFVTTLPPKPDDTAR